MTLREKTVIQKMCGCDKRTFNRREATAHAKQFSKVAGYPIYIYKCPRSRFYHMTKKPQDG